MKKKLIKNILSKLYYRGIYDGIDICRIPRDRFFGNSKARREWEQRNLEDAFKELSEEK